MKPLAILYSKEARKDIYSVFDYIRLFRPSAAENFIESIDRAVRQIADLPRSGLLTRDKKLKDKGYRYVIIDEYLLFYRYSSAHVIILRFVHGRRHYVPLLLS